ncbi:fructokinase-2 [Heracleum sosnowskyi]|uniref:Fructokinase-2 n=1 Tax=Heracleum sosnowskyi TaxID=360622 RepID=A0AAD8IS34_9APIA|nr:fructokinase-2 [Heracleum sosnowskyi]
MEVAKKAGALLSYDPNLRLPLWPSAGEAREKIMSIWEKADVIKVSDNELEFLTGKEVSDEAALSLWHPNLKLLLVTLGENGCSYYTKKFHGNVPGFHVKTVDTTGAGDSFIGALLSKLVKDDSMLTNEAKLKEAIKFACACGAITTTKKGAIPALPTNSEVRGIISRHKEDKIKPSGWQKLITTQKQHLISAMCPSCYNVSN